MEHSIPGKTNLFQNRFVQTIMLSGILLQVGIWVRNFSVLLFVMDKTGNNPLAVSLISVAEFAPIFLFSFIGGTYADRWPPKRTMVWCDIVSALSVFAVLLTLVFGTWQSVFFVTLVSAILSQFSQPSAMKLFKVHVAPEQLQAGMAMFQSLMAIFMVIGPIVGTFVYQTFGIQIAVGVTGVSFLLSAAVLRLLPPDQVEEKTGEENVWQEMVDGFRYVLRTPVLKSLSGAFLFAGLAVGILQPLTVFIVMERLGLPKESVQWLLMVNGLAMLIGGGLVMGLAKKVSPQKLLAMGMLVSAISACGIGLSTDMKLTLVLEFFNGLFFPCIHIGVSTLILQASEEAYIGRVNGVLTPMFMGMMVVTMSAAGWLKKTITLVGAYEAAGVLFLLGMLTVVPLFRMHVGGSANQCNDSSD
ncbi:putative MFS family arabinose efflux permease [Aneurinibacillus soli]|uniref:Enterobactin exporter EntS n=1 Tax=Aneurinibacillus soli TaxID=1500254 RepID=A0A0U5B0K0_9BACL|nr:MFS transporter [Aneurinibacillus soli]PYE61395.1 putative MFS family arabinose efflux permease [Aneurinibacillus soli]BAU27776.1 enterobactin exporter EntS [Aneurinibacillus soli]